MECSHLYLKFLAKSFFAAHLIALANPAASAPTQVRSGQSRVLGTADLAAAALPAVVHIVGPSIDGGEVSGSGFLVDSTGTLVTNLHVVQRMRSCLVRTHAGDVYDRVYVRSFDERRDIAVLRLPGFDLPHLSFGNSDQVKVGQSVTLIGNPHSLEGSVSSGIVSGIRTLEAGYRVIQTDAAANPGNSGGPMLDDQGHVIGVLSFKLVGGENLNFAVPINYVRGMLDDTLHLSLDALRSQLTGIVREQTQNLTSEWKAVDGNFALHLRLDNGYMYLEMHLPEAITRAGGYDKFQLTRDSLGVYRGTESWTTPCEIFDGWSGQGRLHMCSSTFPASIRIISPSRLEAEWYQYPGTDHLRCKTCEHSVDPEPRRGILIPQ